MKKILFVSYGAAHINLQLIIASRLKDIGYNIVFLGLTTAIDKLKETDFEFYTYRDFFYSEDVQKYGKQLLSEMDNSKIDDEQSIAYLGQNYLELVERYGEDGAKEIYEKDSRQSFDPYNSMKYILQQIKPDMVIATDSPRSEKCAVQAANELGILSLVVINTFAIRCKEWVSKNDFANKVCVFSEDVKEYLIGNGRNAKDLVVTGNPIFDSLVNLKQNPKRSLNKLNVLWASQNEPKYFGELDLIGDEKLPINIEKELLRIFEDHNDLNLMIRNHPNEPKRNYPPFVEVCNDEPLIDVINRCDIIITCTSTVGLEGLILGKKLITIDKSIMTSFAPYSKFGYSYGISDIEDLEHAIETIINDKSNLQLKNYSINNATNNVVNEAIKLLNR